MDPALLKKYLTIVGVVCLYWGVSITLVFLNKYLLKSDELKLDAPLFVTFIQCLATVVLSIICRLITIKAPSVMSFPDITFDKARAKATFPLSIIFVSMIAFNNMCLQEVGVAFYNIARCLVTVFSIILSYAILGKSTSFRAMSCAGIVVGGFLLGVNQEGDLGSLSIKGTIYGVVASAFVALNAIYIKKILPVHRDNIWALTYYNNVNAIAIFIPLIVLNGELGELAVFPHLFSSKFWIAMSVSGFFGFIMGYVAGLQVQKTSPVTHNISGVAKACFQTLLATLYWQQNKSWLWWSSTFLVLFGTAAYSMVKSLDMKNVHEVKEATDSEKQQLVKNEGKE